MSIPDKGIIVIAKKREAVETVWGRGSDVWLHFDPRTPGVVVPDPRGPRVILQWGPSMPVPIPDLEMDDESIRGTLSFARQPHHVTVPWAAVFGIFDALGGGVIYRDALPAELDPQEPNPFEDPVERPKLRVVR